MLSSVALIACGLHRRKRRRARRRTVSRFRSVPPADSDFQEIQDTVFTPICTHCHIGANAPQGLRLDAANSYAMLVNVASAEVPGLLRVIPGNPDQSYLVQKIQGTAAVGGRMPATASRFCPRIASISMRQLDRGRRADRPAPRLTTSPWAAAFPRRGRGRGAGLGKLTVIFNGDVDASLASAHLRAA